MSDNNLISKITSLLGIDKDKAIDHIAEMGVDNLLEVVDALNNDDAQRARELLGVEEEDEAAAGQDVEAQESPEQDVEADDEVRISPLFHSVAKTKGKKQKHLTAVEEDDYVPNVGDDVVVGDDEGTVKIANAPADTVGVQIDGEMTMVNKGKVQRGQVSEGVLGMTAMQDLTRMRQLAGLAPAASNDGFSVPTQPYGGEALAPGSFETAVEPEVGTQVVIGAEAESEPSSWLSALRTRINDLSADSAKDDACPTIAPCEAEVGLTVDATAAEGTAAVEAQHDPYLSFDGILSSFDEIEAGLPELRVKDAKVVRQRINALMAKLNETRFTYKPKA